MELGSTVTLAFQGKLEDGTVFGYATADQPMVFQTGMDLAIEGLENNILDMNEVGEKASFVVSMYEAYGEYLEDKTEKVARERIPYPTIKVGQRIWMGSDEGLPEPVTAIEVTNEYVVFDMNHPLAGKDLYFDVEILDIQEPPEGFISAAEKRKMQGQYDDAYTVSGIGDE
ncbi:MAG: FKBP-type peptidyl-prolyl cis-trans isomerase [Coriobacteriia bacterium]|nr:FKBP-type peptidyl-prolyl cis-trans isomerase [Coriobacteriia bacterium]